MVDATATQRVPGLASSASESNSVNTRWSSITRTRTAATGAPTTEGPTATRFISPTLGNFRQQRHA